MFRSTYWYRRSFGSIHRWSEIALTLQQRTELYQRCWWWNKSIGFEKGLSRFILRASTLIDCVILKILEHLLSLRKKSCLPFLVISNANDLMSWNSLLQAQAKDVCYHSYFGSIENQKLIRKTLTDQYFRANDAKAHFVLTTYDIVLESINQFHFDRWHIIVMDEAMRLTDDDHFHDKWCELLTLPCRQKILIADEKNAPDVRLMLQFVIPSLFCSREKLMVRIFPIFSHHWHVTTMSKGMELRCFQSGMCDTSCCWIEKVYNRGESAIISQGRAGENQFEWRKRSCDALYAAERDHHEA